MTWNTDFQRQFANRVERRHLFWLGVLAVQLLTLATYLQMTRTEVREIRYLLYPFVWIDVGVWATMRIGTISEDRQRRAPALLTSIAYFAAMLWIAGLVGSGRAEAASVRIVSAPPGWGPIFALQSEVLRAYVIPFQWLGYAALAYLFYVALLRATQTAVSGLLGVVSCVGCTWTLVAPLATGVLGGVSMGSVGATLYALTYDLSTGIFLLTVGLLLWSAGEFGTGWVSDLRDRIAAASEAQLFLIAVVGVALLKVNAVALVLFTDAFEPVVSVFVSVGIFLGAAGWLLDAWG